MSVGVLTTHVHQVIPCDTQLGGELAHVASEEVLVEVVVTCRNRSVNGVERRSAHHLQRLLEVQALVLNVVNQALQVEQCGMALVAVINLRFDA